MIEKSIVKGRILYIQTKNIVTGNIFNIFSFYGKSNVNKAYAENLISELDKEIQQNELENVIISGDFNFVTSTNDRNTNKFTQTDNLYRQTWNTFEIKNDLMDCFRNLYTKRRLYTFSQTGGKSKSRIDRLYLSSNLIGKIQKVNFETIN